MGGARVIGVLVVGGLLAVPVAKAEILRFKAELSRVDEDRRDPGRPSGRADLTLDTDARTLNWRVTYAGLSGPVTGGRFQTPPEPPAALAMPSQLTAPFASPIAASGFVNDIQIGDLRAGLWSIVLSTTRHPMGEIRGAIERAP